MTGFGSAEGEVGGARISVEIRSVNHRFFNPSIKLPSELGKWEGDVREALRKGVARGHVTLFARIERREVEGARIDEAQFEAYVAQIRRLQERLSLGDAVDVGAVLRLPNVISSQDEAPTEEATGTAAELMVIVERGVAALDLMRSAEGARLAQYLAERLSVIEQAVERIDARAPQRLVEQRDRLRLSIRELADGVALDDQRLAQEVAILADRLDVAEEVSRFHSHFAAFRATLASPAADGVGKRLGFLLQELLREANTTGSKANDASMLQDVIVIKEELERIREQVENLE
ncbi:MAG TPA: YicC/YloC family endoribonuclease [Gemmatimonadaceae bacterium]|nr:YicC/YloC family endoribonuclease [Gemmatimonadaceae bacterium]